MNATSTRLVERLRAWTYRRQLLGRATGDALAALRAVIGVYSTHPTAPLSLLARSGLRRDDLPRLEQERKVVRIPGMRESTFLVARQDAALVFGATRQPEQRLERRLRDGGVDPPVYRDLGPRVLACARQPRLPREIAACAGDPAATLVARVLARGGQILRVNRHLRVDQLRYVATDAWLGEPLAPVERVEALRWLAHAYLHAFGPARVEDFRWWAALSRHEAARVLAGLDLAEADGGLLLRREDAQDFEQVTALDADSVDVLPKWDAYTMAYAPDGRQRLVRDEHAALAYTSREGSPGATAGDGLPVVLHGGRAVASWSHRFVRQQMLIEVAPWPGERVDADALRQPFQRVAELMQAEVQVQVRSASTHTGSGNTFG